MRDYPFANPALGELAGHKRHQNNLADVQESGKIHASFPSAGPHQPLKAPVHQPVPDEMCIRDSTHVVEYAAFGAPPAPDSPDYAMAGTDLAKPLEDAMQSSDNLRACLLYTSSPAKS